MKFTKKKSEKNNLPIIWFLESKVPYKNIKKKMIKINHFTFHTLNSNCNLKYL